MYFPTITGYTSTLNEFDKIKYSPLKYSNKIWKDSKLFVSKTFIKKYTSARKKHNKGKCANIWCLYT